MELTLSGLDEVQAGPGTTTVPPDPPFHNLLNLQRRTPSPAPESLAWRTIPGTVSPCAAAEKPIKNSREEMRKDTDGRLYTRKEFEDFYGGDAAALEWARAEPVESVRKTSKPTVSVFLQVVALWPWHVSVFHLCDL